MKKFRIKQYVSLLGNIRYGVDEKFFLLGIPLFWIFGESFSSKEEAIKHYNKLTEKI